jgi:hypothetical protein
MVWLLLASIAFASSSEQCAEITTSDVLAVQAPAVIVLGERHGTQPDLNRAKKIVRKLHTQAQVTLAIEAVHERFQPVLDRYEKGLVDPPAMQRALEWDKHWSFDYNSYRSLVTSANWGVKVLAAGHDEGTAPKDGDIPIPAGYLEQLRPAMGEQPVPAKLGPALAREMSWRSLHIAELAQQGWNGEGYLVILAHRALVEGGLGVSWHAERLFDPPVHAFVLAWAKSPCFAGDAVYKPAPLESR